MYSKQPQLCYNEFKSRVKKIAMTGASIYSLHTDNALQKGEKNPFISSYATKSQTLTESSIFCTTKLPSPNFNIHLLLTDIHV